MRLIEALIYTRIFSRVVIVAFAVIILGIFLFNLLKPTPPLAVVFNPDYGCGALPPIKFPENKVDYSRANIEINTQEEALRNLPPIAYVFKVQYEGETLALRDRIFNIVQILNFDADIYKNPKPYLLRWSDDQRYIIADTRTGSFIFSFNRKKLLTLPPGQIVFIDDAKSVAKSALSSLSLLEGYEDYDLSTLNFRFDLDKKTSEVKFERVDSLAEADAVRVDFFGKKTLLVFDYRLFLPEYRKKLNLSQKIDYVALYENRKKIDDRYRKEYVVKTVTDNAKVGNPSIFVHTNQKDLFKDQVARIQYFNWDIEEKPCGTYPLRDIPSVFNTIQNKSAYIAYLGIFGGSEVKNYSDVRLVTISITDVELAYYASSTNWSEYLQPIYIAKGWAYDDQGVRYEIVFYVDAILQRKAK